MKIPFKIRKILNKFKKKNIQQDSFELTENQIKSILDRFGKDLVIYGSKEQIDKIERIKNETER